jgi:tRNA dimethylallyltransferase
VVIVGPTASGKTGAAISLAKKIGGEIISADSRAIYKYMDIGTAKPSVEEQDGVPHFGIDLVEPGERFTAYDFKKYAEEKISEICSRGHVPIIAGGTGLYVDAIVFDYQFDGLSKDEKHGTPEGNESAGDHKDRAQMDKRFLVFGISWEPEELRERITKRMTNMYSPELYAETKFLVNKFGWDSQAMKSNVYQFVWRYLNNEINLDEAISLSVQDDIYLAKRQMTRFRRNREIKWVRLSEIEQEILSHLS